MDPLTGSPAFRASAPRQIGAYEIIEEIGRGGMGVVYAAKHIHLGRIVALKVINAGGLATSEQEMRFVREAQTAARLQHPNIVAVHDAGFDEGIAYFTMDLVPDGDLALRLRDRPLAPRDAALLLQKTAAAVAHAHREGILHRDLKPSNILLDGDEPRVADFGLAGQLEAGGGLTAVTRALGTPAYLAPETYFHGSKAASPASDVYALGAILYEALTGRPPFLGELAPALTPREPVAPHLLGPGIPRDLETITLKCLEHSPTARYADATALADDLARFLDGRPILARPVSSLNRFARWCRRRPALAALWFVVFALAVAFGTTALLVAAARSRAVKAEEVAVDRLWQSQLAQATALVGTHRIGQRNDALAVVTAAARHRVTPELRDAAIVALTQVDLRFTRTWHVRQEPERAWIMLADFSTSLVEPKAGVMEMHAYPDDALRGILDGSAWGPITSPLLPSPDGRMLLACYADRHIRAWSLEEKHVTATVASPPAIAGTMAGVANADFAWRPDGKEFAVARSGGGLAFYSALDGHETRHWLNELMPTAVSYSPQGRWIAATHAESRRLWFLDATSLEVSREILLLTEPRMLTWHPGGLFIAVGGQDKIVRMIDPAQGTVVHELIGHRAPVRHAVFSPDGSLLATNGADATVRLWDCVTGDLLLTAPGVGGLADTVFSSDGTKLSFSKLDLEGQVAELSVRDVVHSAPAEHADDRGALSASADFSPDGRWWLFATWAGIDIYDTRTLQRVASDPAVDPRDEHSAQFSPDEHWLYAASRKRGLWKRECLAAKDTFTLGPPQMLDAETGFILHAVSKDGGQIVLSSRKASAIKVVATRDGSLIHRLEDQLEPMDATLSADGKFLATQCNGRGKSAALGTRIWSTKEWKIEREFFDLGPLGMVTFSPDGRWLAIAGLKGFRVLRTSDWLESGHQWPESVRKAGAVSSFSADGELIAVTVDDKVFLLRPATGEKLALLESPTANASTARARLSPDATRLTVLWDDASFDVWNLSILRSELQPLGLDW